MAEFFMWKLTVNPPPPAFIELDGPNIRLDHAQATYFMSTTADLKFRLRE